MSAWRPTQLWAVWFWVTLIALSAASRAQAASSGNAVTPETDGPSSDTLESKYRVEIDLATGRIDKTLPFDVPFVLEGDTDREDLVGIRAHAFEAPHSFRIDQRDEKLRCVRQGPLRRSGPRRTEWPRDFSLEDVESDEDDAQFVCGRLPKVASWSRPPTARAGNPPTAAAGNPPSPTVNKTPFSLRIPPLDVNHYFVFIFELELEPEPSRLDSLKREMETVVATALVETAKTIDVRKIERGEYREAVENLRKEVRRQLNRVVVPYVVGGRTEEESFFEPNAPFDLELRGALTDTVAKITYELPEQLKICETNWASLRSLLIPQTDGDDGTERLPEFSAGMSEEQAAAGRSILESENACSTEDKLVPGKLAELRDWSCGVTRINGLDASVLVPASDLCDAIERIEYLTAGADVSNAVELINLEVDDDLVFLEANSVGAFEIRQTRHFNADIGFLAAPDLDQAYPYIGTNIYFRPVNKDAPLTGWEPLKRCGVTIGATVFENFGGGDDRVDPLFSKAALVLGGGCRVTEYARLGIGTLFFRENDPDPLVDDRELSASPYVSVSIDWDIWESFDWLRRIFSNLGTKPGG